MLKFGLILGVLFGNVCGANVSGLPLPKPLPDTCLLVGSEPATACQGNCPPCWVLNIKGQVECYDYVKGTKQCLGWQGMEDVSQQLVDKAKQKGYYNATSLPKTATAGQTSTNSGTVVGVGVGALWIGFIVAATL